MKKTLLILCGAVLLLSTAACAREMTDEEILQRAEEIKAGQTAAAETAASTAEPSPTAGPSASAVPAETEAPDDSGEDEDRMLSEALGQSCNPFYGMTELSDQYLLYRIDMGVNAAGETTYTLKYMVQGNTLGFASDMIEVFQLEGIDAEAAKAKIEGGQSVSFSAQISSVGVQATGQMYEDGNNDALSLQTSENGSGIGAFIDLNINRSIFSDARTEALFSGGVVVKKELSILAQDHYMFSKITFDVGEELDAYLQAYTSDAFLDLVRVGAYTQPEVTQKDGDTEVSFSQNRLECEITLSNTDQTVVILQGIGALDTYLSEYLEPEFHAGSLTALGFSVDEETGMLYFKDDTAQVQIDKTALGAQNDRVSVVWNDHPDFGLSIVYDIDTQSYTIRMTSQEGNTAGMIVEQDGRVKGINPYKYYVWELDDIPDITGMGVVETGEALRQEFNDYLSDVFGMSADEIVAAELK